MILNALLARFPWVSDANSFAAWSDPPHAHLVIFLNIDRQLFWQVFEGQPAALEQQYAGFIQPGAFAVADPATKGCGTGLVARRDLRALLEVRNVMTNVPADALAPQGDFGLLLVLGHRQAPGARRQSRS